MLQGTGKRRSALVIYMEPWHYDIYDFLDLKETNGNEYVRTRVTNTALWVSDNFMERVQSDSEWYMFDPAETPGLVDTWGEEFTANYDAYAAEAEAGNIRCWKKAPARELYYDIMLKLAKTGNYWMTYKDTHNRGNQVPRYAPIHSSNLCTEISIPNTGESTAVCIIASVNLTRFYDKVALKAISREMPLEEKMKLIDWDGLKETVEVVTQALDNEIEFNFFPHPHGEKNCRDLRSIGV